MKHLLFILLSLFILLCIINVITRILLVILRRQNKKLSKKGAYLDYEIINNAYEVMMICRRVHYEAYSIEDQIEKQNVQKECREKYEYSVKTLEAYERKTEFMQYLTEAEQNEIKEVLASPRYGIY
jgi:hypothetical protein